MCVYVSVYLRGVGWHKPDPDISDKPRELCMCEVSVYVCVCI